MKFADYINDYLEKNDMTAKALAALTGVSESSIYKCRWGENCRDDIKEKVAKVIGYVEEKPEPEFEPEIEYVDRKEASERMGISKNLLDAGLRAGVYPFGVAFKNRGDSYNYFIYRTDFEEFIEKHRMPR